MKIRVNIDSKTIQILKQESRDYCSYTCRNGVRVGVSCAPASGFEPCNNTLAFIWLRGQDYSNDFNYIYLNTFQELIQAVACIDEFCKVKQWELETNFDIKRVELKI